MAQSHTLKPNHRIGRLAVRLNTNNTQQALGARLLLRERINELADELTEQLDAIAGEHDWVHIPALAISIKQSELNVENIFDQIKTQLLLAVKEVVENKQVADVEYAQAGPFTIDGEELSANRLSAPYLTGLSQNKRLALYLQHYLVTGSLPWHVDSLSRIEHQWQQLFESPEYNLANTFKPVNFTQWLRFAALLNIQQLTCYLNEWQSGSSVSQQQAKLVQSLINLLPVARASLVMPEHVLVALLGIITTPNIAEHELNLAPWLASFIKHSMRSFLIDERRVPTAIVELLEERLSEKLPKHWFVAPESSSLAKQIDTSRELESNVIPISQAKKQAVNVNDTQQEKPATRTQWAGLVLLFPYLPRLFNACNIVLDEKRIAVNQLPLAARLLAHLAQGEHFCHEYQLGTIKLLLGLPLDAALPLENIPLTTAEIEQCESLLASFINHWAAIKNTSIDGVRSAFLQREGYAKLTDQGWSIYIERNGYDALLDQLPFSLSVVKLPWMKHALQIEW
ncbi:contractile injection system tape measure protein [Saccharophagus degradans]|uniref:Contractile injection system tape measure protein n=1 Tax=Saccharophagus degradans TaxID=86304 RepID=A0AAW7XBM6_9GAMM|nr:contractile injection system tape measure protein [Saccharophagus degradans]MDO6423986.1 contractile injection system tape measure protein [Saccharophagus degradans]MDO6609175.1 contractile injection system tape measure protein [Saccharophagus degradans]